MEGHDKEVARKKALLAALEATAGSISAEDYPEWSTPEKVAAWVRALRYGKPLPDVREESKDD
jgi:hypothetical protein